MQLAPPPARPILFQPWLAKLLLVMLVLASASGCVRRRLNVRSNPPGAMVFVDNQMIGTTPCSMDFTYYGTREIRLVKSGYETLTVNQPIPTPWWQVPPLDFFSDNFALHKIRDDRTVSFNLEQQMMLPAEEIIRRGEELRSRTMSGTVLPTSGEVPVPPLPVQSTPGVITTSPTIPMSPPGGFVSPPPATLPPPPPPQTPWP
ncbi:PEGA domain-containing protein [Aeoliella sp. SH292]|uniref:PEGA domain-containing protein n=1 Tax=Aeoliella sp. SH292 TaxID=3454464 RepID=UPI003F96A079